MLSIIEKQGNMRSLAQVFSTATFRKIVKNDDTTVIDYGIKQHLANSRNYSYLEIISFLYKKLEQEYRNEYIYKNALLNKKLLGQYSLNTTTVLDEFKINQSIADFVLLNGEARVFEIKTDLDSLEKLDKQLSDYQKFANKIVIVVSNKYSKKLLDRFKHTSIGIIEFRANGSLKTLKEAVSDSSKFDYLTIFKTLRKAEYLEIIKEELNLILDVPNTIIFKRALELIKGIEIAEFQKLTFEKIKARKLKCPERLAAKTTPKELKHICYSLNFSEKEYFKLSEFLKRKT